MMTKCVVEQRDDKRKIYLKCNSRFHKQGLKGENLREARESCMAEHAKAIVDARLNVKRLIRLIEKIHREDPFWSLNMFGEEDNWDTWLGGIDSNELLELLRFADDGTVGDVYETRSYTKYLSEGVPSTKERVYITLTLGATDGGILAFPAIRWADNLPNIIKTIESRENDV